MPDDIHDIFFFKIYFFDMFFSIYIFFQDMFFRMFYFV